MQRRHPKDPILTPRSSHSTAINTHPHDQARRTKDGAFGAICADQWSPQGDQLRAARSPPSSRHPNPEGRDAQRTTSDSASSAVGPRFAEGRRRPELSNRPLSQPRHRSPSKPHRTAVSGGGVKEHFSLDFRPAAVAFLRRSAFVWLQRRTGKPGTRARSQDRSSDEKFHAPARRARLDSHSTGFRG
jgi:hypothetical protein